ncbi:hypothetical protein NC796_23150 [Aliifodinibius sp. S!AR15-10]|uniref:hypothetical protein n=1 Tax=Aliifodinibius sp. S!AR15-10 TaxID=2950437 RepID=UPI00285A4D3D|nr:hypothetical protein [Aliifodinibius sp. S!AR15-10]MDR8394070.1 hypothetical protein [Aliifodinibius sp. S!AR15-10]
MDFPNEHLNYNGTTLNGKQLAEILDVAPPTLSEAVKYGYNCGGYPVEEWVLRSNSGRVKGYYVPKFLVDGEHQIEKNRENPQPVSSDESELQETDDSSEETPEDPIPQVTNNTYSLLPEGEDYIKPVGMAALSSTLTSVVEEDTPQSRAIIITLLGILGAFAGHAVTDDTKGAGIGAGAGLVIALLGYASFNQTETSNNNLKLPIDDNDHQMIGESSQSAAFPQLEFNSL